MFKKSLLFLLGIIATLALVLSALFYFQPRIPAGVFLAPISSLATVITGHKQQFQGDLYITPGALTLVDINDGKILSVESKDSVFQAHISSVSFKIEILPLLQGVFSFDGITLREAVFNVQSAARSRIETKSSGFFFSNVYRWLSFLHETGTVDIANLKILFKNNRANLVEYVIRQGEGHYSAKEGGQFEIAATVNGEAFNLHFQGDQFQHDSVASGKKNFSLSVIHKSISGKLDGKLASVKKRVSISAADFIIAGDNFNDVTALFGGEKKKNQPFHVNGKLKREGQKIEVDFNRIELGLSNFATSFSMEHQDREKQFTVKIKGKECNIRELQSYLAVFVKGKKSGVQNSTNVFNSKLKEFLASGQFDVELDLEKLIISNGEIFKNVRIASSIRDLIAKDSSFSADFQNGSITGVFSLFLDKDIPKLSVQLDLSSLNVGKIFEKFKLTKGFALSFQKVTVELTTEGKSIDDILQNLQFKIHSKGGNYAHRDINSGETLVISIVEAKMAGTPMGKITLDLLGELGKHPLSMSIELEGKRGQKGRTNDKYFVRQKVTVVDTSLEVTGMIVLPYTGKDLSLQCIISGNDLSSLNILSNIDLPQVGPYTLEGLVEVVEEGYRLQNLKFETGASTLTGNMSLNTLSTPFNVEMNLYSTSIQLDDFKNIWMSTDKIAHAGVEQIEKKESDIPVDNKLKYLTDQEILEKYNGLLSLTVDEVLGGETYLGKGHLAIQQKDGRLEVSPFKIHSPQGNIDISLSLAPAENERDYVLKIDVADLKYGFIARWFKEGSRAEGQLSMHVSLASKSPDFKSIMANGSGKLDILVQPLEQDAGSIDLWAVNFISYLTSFLFPDEDSKVNCAAGKFILEDGVLSQDSFLIDTSQIQVQGKINVDFKTQLITGELVPKAKTAQFLSLATPVEVKGKISDFDVGVATGGMVGTLVRMGASPLSVPLRWLFLKPLPEDGTDMCLELMKQ